jgi:hypothetical protein
MYQLVRYNVLKGTRKIMTRSNDAAELLEMAVLFPPNERKYHYTIIEPVN